MTFKSFVPFVIILTVLATTAFGDVKIKARQTMSGQTTENTTYIKGKRQRTEQTMSGFSSVTLTQCDLKRSVQLNPQAQAYLITSWANDETVPATVRTDGNTRTEVRKGGVVTTTVTIKDTGETRKMFGYIARHLIITTETESSADACAQGKSKMMTDGWYIDAAFVLDCDNGRYSGYRPAENGGGCRDRYEFKQIGAGKRGYPVIETMKMFDESGKESFTMTNEVVELSNTTLDAALFEVPAGYREAQNSAALYSASTSTSNVSYTSNQSTSTSTSLGSTIATKDANPAVSPAIDDKKPGVVRIGLAGVKTGSVGEGINATELAGAIENSLGEYLKGTKIEIVRLEAKLPAAIESEATEKQCDYVLSATVSHKTGGGGFGMFGKIAPALGNVVTAMLTKQYKSKAKSAGEDIISPLVEQAATAIVENAK